MEFIFNHFQIIIIFFVGSLIVRFRYSFIRSQEKILFGTVDKDKWARSQNIIMLIVGILLMGVSVIVMIHDLL